MHADKHGKRQPKAGERKKNVNPDSIHAASKERAARKRTRRKTMNRYQISSPRKLFAMGALIMTAITIVVSLVVPTQMQSGARDPRTLAASKTTTPAPVEVAASPLRVEVVGIRDPELISVHVRHAPAQRKQES
jgi:hypothetical protein